MSLSNKVKQFEYKKKNKQKLKAEEGNVTNNRKSKYRIIKITIYAIVAILVTIIVVLFSHTGGSGDMSVSSNKVGQTLPHFVDEFNHISFLMEKEQFKILQLTDIHFGNGWWTKSKDKKAMTAVKTLIEETSPDIIIITGDVVYPMPIQTATRNNMLQFEVFSKFMEGFEIPWTIVFGNHDAEAFATHTKKQIGEYLESLKFCFFKNNDIGITGLGNNVVNIYNKDKTINNSLFLFDSGNTINNLQFLGYEKIADDQVEWYENEVKRMGYPKSLAFMHVPQLEYKIAWEKFREGSEEVKYHFGKAGEIGEKISCAKEQSALFDKMVELNSTKGVFAGHDHLNDYSVSYKGIRLTFSKSIDYTAYLGISKKTDQRGGTLITINKDSTFNISPIKLEEIANK